MTDLHEPVVAGLFYPENPDELRTMVSDLLAQSESDYPPPKAIISPHAGYIYSGPIAASAYACLPKLKGEISRVVLLGPAHRYAVPGMAVHSAKQFATPLGKIPIDQESVEKALSLPQVEIIDDAFAQEHSLEVQLPFLQMTLADFSLVPILVGFATDVQVAEVLELLWDGPSTLVVISSDLSHYLDYQNALSIDLESAQAILHLDSKNLRPEQACGAVAIRGLLEVARRKNLKVELLDLRNSGDTSGQKDHVVGYSAFHFRES